MRCRRYILIYCLCLAVSSVFAEEKPAEGFIVNPNYSGAQNLEWEKMQTKLGAVKGRLDMQLSIIKRLIADKAQMTGKDLAIKMDELKKEHVNLQKIMDEHNSISMEFHTKFPERGIKESRVYKRIKPKSLRAYEQEYSMQERVNKLHEKILQQYSRADGELKIKNENIQPVQQVKKKDSKKSDQKEVTDEIIFKK